MTKSELTAANAARMQTLGYSNDREWDQYTVRASFEVGRCGSSRSYRGATGDKLHLLRVETIVAERGEHVRGTYKVGERSSVKGCNSNGQHTGIVVEHAELSDITCTKCLKDLAQIVKACEETAAGIMFESKLSTRQLAARAAKYGKQVAQYIDGARQDVDNLVWLTQQAAHYGGLYLAAKAVR